MVWWWWDSQKSNIWGSRQSLVGDSLPGMCETLDSKNKNHSMGLFQIHLLEKEDTETDWPMEVISLKTLATVRSYLPCILKIFQID